MRRSRVGAPRRRDLRTDMRVLSSIDDSLISPLPWPSCPAPPPPASCPSRASSASARATSSSTPPSACSPAKAPAPPRSTRSPPRRASPTAPSTTTSALARPCSRRRACVSRAACTPRSPRAAPPSADPAERVAIGCRRFVLQARSRSGLGGGAPPGVAQHRGPSAHRGRPARSPISAPAGARAASGTPRDGRARSRPGHRAVGHAQRPRRTGCRSARERHRRHRAARPRRGARAEADAIAARALPPFVEHSRRR